MAEDFKIGAGIELNGSKEFETAVKDINKSMTVLGSEMKKVTAEFADNANSTEALTAKQDVLSRQVNDQALKVNVLKEALENAKKEYGDNSDKAQEWQIKLNNAEAALAKTESSLRQTTEQLNNYGKEANQAETETKQLGDDFDKAGKDALNFGDILKANVLSDVIMGGLRAMGNAIQQAFGQFKQVASESMDTADSLMALSSETGMTTEQLQVMQYQGDNLGVSLDTMTGSMNKMINNMSSAKAGTGTAAEAFKTLGISVTDSNGNLRDSKQVYAEALQALNGVTNETERTAIAQDIFGKSAAELNPLIEAGADGLAQLEEQARNTGAVMSDETVAALDSLGDSLGNLKTSITTAAGNFVAQFAPALDEVSQKLAGLLNGTVSVDDFMASVNELVTQVSTAITSALPQLIELGGTILTSLLSGIIAALPQIVPAAVEVLMQLTTTIIENLPLLIEAALQIIVSLANGLAESLPEMIPTIIDVVITIVETLIENVDQLVDASIEIIIALAEGLITALPQLIEKAPEIIIKLVTAIIENVPKMLEAAVALMVQLSSGIASGFVEILGKVGGWIDTNIIQPIKDKVSSFVTIGGDLIKGVWQGISDKSEWLWGQVSGFFTSLTDRIKNFFGIASPSKLFRDEIGANLADGIGVGFSGQMKSVAKQMQNSIPTSFDGPAVTNARAIDNAMKNSANMMAAAVNAIGTNGGGNQRITIEVPLYVNGKEFYRASINDLWSVMSSNPRVVSDAI